MSGKALLQLVQQLLIGCQQQRRCNTVAVLVRRMRRLRFVDVVRCRGCARHAVVVPGPLDRHACCMLALGRLVALRPAPLDIRDLALIDRDAASQ